MAVIGLDFERHLIELEKQIDNMKKSSEEGKIDLSDQIAELQMQLNSERKKLYSNLTPVQKIKIARHPERPYTLDFIRLMMTDFIELHGDRLYADDLAVVCGIARMDDYKLMVIGQQKGRDTKENLMRNFGMMHPEGYRKAYRMMKMAERFEIPILCLIDTPGAYPGIGAEERGQAQAIAFNIREMIKLKTPVIIIITGEGCSGGALGIGVGDVVSIFQYGYYSVISPEGCAAIRWRDAKMMPDAARALKLTADDLLGLGIVDEVIPEPLGGAHRDHSKMAAILKKHLTLYLEKLGGLRVDELLESRYQKFRQMGVFEEKIIKLEQDAADSAEAQSEDETPETNLSGA
jgi:acetyl-CoA carboxylase carboxyl transferase subunit alpha